MDTVENDKVMDLIIFQTKIRHSDEMKKKLFQIYHISVIAFGPIL
jgi:hypothetical protein